MRTNVVLEDKLVHQALRCARVKTKKELFAIALKEFVKNHSRLDLKDLQGKVRIRPGYDYKALRIGA